MIEEEKNILESITKAISSKLKAPIVVTYICVLVIYNWDILFYLFFETSTASSKIAEIKQKYGAVYFERIAICLSLAMALIVLFTILNTLLSFCLKWFYRKDKEIITEIENFEKVSLLSEQLSRSVDEIKKLKQLVENLQKINQSLSSKSLDITASDISKKDFNDLIDFLQNQPNAEKLIFSLKELTKALKKNKDIEIQTVEYSITYKKDYEKLLDILNGLNLLIIRRNSWNGTKSVDKFELSKSFIDFLEMNI